MIIVDAQVHIWAPPTKQRPWVEGGERYAHRAGNPLGATELIRLMDEAGVNRAILVPPSWEGYRNDVVKEAATAHPLRFAWMGRVRLDRRVQAQALLRSLHSRAGALGVRLTFVRGIERGWLRDGTADWFWREAAALGLPVMVFAPDGIDVIERTARMFPDLRLIVDHLGIPTQIGEHGIATWVEPLLRLSELRNVAVKASSLPCAAREPYPFASTHWAVQAVVEHYGADRVFWGSDLTRLPCTYEQAVTLFRRELAFLKGDELAQVMGGGILKWLAWS